MDAIGVLTQDHREVEQLFKRFPGETSQSERRATAENLIRELSRHDAVEVQLLYPAVRKDGTDGDRLAEHSLEEHKEAREVLSDLDGKLDQVMSPEFLTVWQRLEQMIAAHVAEEEGEIFPLMRSTMSAAELDELGERIQSAKKLAPTHPHTSTPDSAAGATVMGTAAGVLDKVRDTATGRSAE